MLRYERSVPDENAESRTRRKAQKQSPAASAVMRMNQGSRASAFDSATTRHTWASAINPKTLPVVKRYAFTLAPRCEIERPAWLIANNVADWRHGTDRPPLDFRS